ncbi:Bug family tripartite tricarboxylate transporter substrate binding protein [Phreatobacter stygius]|uniref:Tripartite tricarboxylate transporter substrate binding protein n=1 Tax=Phreatobacter stygius TaxID=1940610 RepID=A0A4D7BDA3_9HYPH|nr:tripartite tricarboxylate transporter substrate binding protein [Phreatobacter stygius]QCI65962.1 tripartite tricarboxylate transporter substrate binding protein [Phreatobacter stygius]
MSFSRRRFVAGSAAFGVLSSVSQARAQPAFPSQPVRVIVPFAAGGTTDMLARQFGQRMQEALGQPVVIENIGGAGGSIGAERVARSAADGHTLLFHNLTFSATTAALQAAGRSPHDIEKDFAPVSLGANVPMVVMAGTVVPAKDLREFVAYAKSSSQPLFYGSTGPGSVMHLVSEVLKRDGGIRMEHVPFRGAAPLMQEMIAGRVQFGGDQLSTSLEFIRANSVKPLATLAAERMAPFPDVPTVRELGFPNMELRGWNGFFAPKATPAAVIQRLQGVIQAAAADPELRRRLSDVGAEAVGSSPDELGRVVSEQVAKVRPLVAELKLLI